MNTVVTEELKQLPLKRAEHFPVEGFLYGSGSLNPKFMIVGEAPGETELINELPFSGRAGKELDKFLESIEVTREEIYITSVFRSRPWKEKTKYFKSTGKMETKKYNRTPTKKELIAHAPIIDYEIKTLDPPFILTMGNIALNRLIGGNEKITSAHGKLYRGPIQYLPDLDATEYSWTEKEYVIYPTFHPASVFYNRKLQETIYSDLEEFRKLIN